jgi:hypothetical protein
MKNIFVFICLSFLLAGCLNSAESSKRQLASSTIYLGFTTDALIKTKGAPGSVAVLPTGESVWTYRISKTRQTEAVKGAKNNNKIDLHWIETARFIIDSNGTVKNYTISFE